MTRSKVTLYVSDEEKRQLETEAEENDQTVSAYGKQLLDRGRMAEAEESLPSRTDVEAALERTIETTIAEYHDELLDAVRKASVYSIANYELDAHTADASGALRQDTFGAGRRRTHAPLSEHSEAMADDSATADDEQAADTDGSQADDGDGEPVASLGDLRSRE
jgi:hypothetical protein